MFLFIDVSIKWVKHTINWHLLHVEIDERFGGTCTFWIFASKNIFTIYPLYDIKIHYSFIFSMKQTIIWFLCSLNFRLRRPQTVLCPFHILWKDLWENFAIILLKCIINNVLSVKSKYLGLKIPPTYFTLLTRFVCRRIQK